MNNENKKEVGKMREKRDLQQLVYLMREIGKDKALICLGVKRSVVFGKRYIVWQGMQSKDFYEEGGKHEFLQ
jgi:hypothetical protein